MSRTPARVTEADLSPSSPLSFEEAAETLLRGTVTANTLLGAGVVGWVMPPVGAIVGWL